MNSLSQPDSFFAIADPTRRKILTLISKQECSVNELVKRFNMSQPAISQHLRVLEDAGLVSVRTEGTRRFYRTRPEALAQLRDYLEQFWRDSLQQLAEAAEAEEGRTHGDHTSD